MNIFKSIPFTIIVTVVFCGHAFAATNVKDEDELRKKTEVELATYKSAVEAYRLNDSISVDLQKLETERKLKEVTEKYEALLAEKQRELEATQGALESAKKSTYKPIKIEYTGGEGLKRWTLPRNSNQKNIN